MFGNEAITADTIAGTYHATISQRLSQIQLNRDGIYIHRYFDTHLQSNTGKWTIEEVRGNKHIILTDFVSFPGEEAVLGKADGGYYLLRITTYLGEVKLIYDVDLGLAYTKL